MSLVGRLEDLALSDIFQILSIGKKTGTLVLRGSRGNALIVFKLGLVVRAETDSIEGTLADDLLNAQVIKDTIFHLASEVKKKLPEKSVAEILFEFGSLSKDTLEKITRKRLEKIVYELLFWQDGTGDQRVIELGLGEKLTKSVKASVKRHTRDLPTRLGCTQIILA